MMFGNNLAARNALRESRGLSPLGGGRGPTMGVPSLGTGAYTPPSPPAGLAPPTMDAAAGVSSAPPIATPTPMPPQGLPPSMMGGAGGAAMPSPMAQGLPPGALSAGQGGVPQGGAPDIASIMAMLRAQGGAR